MFWIRDVDRTKSAEGLTADRLSRLQMIHTLQFDFRLQTEVQTGTSHQS